jgi:mevalonate kinase
MSSQTTRIKSNSETLKGKFPEIYQDLFSRCFLVTSAPGTFWWSGEYGVRWGGMAITQKIPLRTYIGLEATDGGRVKLGDYKAYIISDKEFRSSAVEEPSASNLIRFVETWLKKRNYNKGITIHIVSEIPYRSGLNASGAFAASLSLSLHLLVDAVTPKEIEKWKNIPASELIKENKYCFVDIFHTSRHLNSMFHGSIHSGASPFAPLLNTPYPVIYFAERAEETKEEIKTEKNIFDQQEKIIKSTNFLGLRMEELFSFLKNQPPWPIDFGLIFSGTTRMSAHVINSILQNTDGLRDTALFIKKEFKKYLTDNGTLFMPSFYEIVNQKEAGEKLLRKYIDPLMIVPLELLKAFKGIFQMGLSETNIKSFFEIMNKNYDILTMLGISNANIDYISSFLRKETKKFGTEFGIALKTTGSGKGGDLLFAVASRDLYYKIDSLIEQLDSAVQYKISLDYASWIDGISQEGVKVEQSLTHKISSDFIIKGSIYLKTLSSLGRVESSIYTINDFENEKPKMDLLINPFEKAIYVRGEKLTSREIHSTRATTGLIKILLDNFNKEVSNRDLPKSSYGSDRNEFQSKIISPLSKIILNRTKKKINFSLRGRLVDFRIKIGPSDVGIFYVERSF